MKKYTEKDFPSLEKGLSAVYFYSETCGPCKQYSPILDELATKYSSKLTFGKVDAAESLNISNKYQVRTIPTIVLLSDGKLKQLLIGSLPKDKVSKSLDDFVTAESKK